MSEYKNQHGDYACLTPPASLLVKLGSLIVYLESGASGRMGDLFAARDIARDPEVEQWFLEMDKLALLPLKR